MSKSSVLVVATLTAFAWLAACGSDDAPGLFTEGPDASAEDPSPLATAWSPLEVEHAISVIDQVSTRFVVKPSDEAVREAAARGLPEPETRPFLPPSVVAQVVREGSVLVPQLLDPVVAGAPGLADVRLPLRASEPFTVRDRDSGMQIAVSLQGAEDVEASFADGHIVYPGAVARVRGGDVILRPRADGVEDYLTVNERPDVAEVRYRVQLGDQVRGLRLVADVVEFVDDDNGPRLRMAPPWIVGADGEAKQASVRVDGCAYDRDESDPWGKTPVEPGARECSVVVAWDRDELEYPALLDPAWTTTASMATARYQHTATRILSSGGAERVLVTGGWGSSGTLASTEYFNVAANTWASGGSLPSARVGHTATALTNPPTNGTQVLVCGGVSAGTVLSECRRWTGSGWTSANAMWPRYGHTAVLLRDGRVLVMGGRFSTTAAYTLDTTQLYSTGGAWSSGPTMPSARFEHAAVRLDDGISSNDIILYAGGTNASGFLLSSAARIRCVNYGSCSNWSSTASMSTARDRFPMVRLGTQNRAFVMNPYDPQPGTAQIYDNAANSWTTITPPQAHFNAVASLIDNSRVLVVGRTTTTDPFILSATVYNFSTSQWLIATPLTRFDPSATQLSSGRVLAAAGRYSSVSAASNIFQPMSHGSSCPSSARPGDCLSGVCTFGICCSGACSGNNKTCSTTNGACVCETGKTTCGTLSATNNCCLSTQYCSNTTAPGTCSAKKLSGSSCSSDVECTSGVCLGGRCCASGSCSGSGKTCNTSGACICATGYTTCGSYCCSSAQYCNGTSCASKKSGGSTCSGNSECVSGSCLGGRCCSSSCSGSGKSCTSTGTCVCATGTASCGTLTSTSNCCTTSTQYCSNSASSICSTKLGGGAICNANGDCSSNVCLNNTCCSSACSGSGKTCTSSGGCACDSGYTACGTVTATSNCCGNASQFCDDASTSTCGGKKSNGATCAAAAECGSGFCVDGYCCDSACDAICRACSAAKTGGSDGQCDKVAANTDPNNSCADQGTTSCNQDGFCDGSGACQVYPTGTACLAPACSNGTLEISTCTGVQICTAASTSCDGFKCNATETACLEACSNDGDCMTASHYCDSGTCQPKKDKGEACTGPSQCNSGNCADGFCCLTPCTSTCMACSAALKETGVDGECGAAKNGLDPHGDCTPSAAITCLQDGTCDGGGACRLHPAGTSCGNSWCDGNDVKGQICNGSGQCLASSDAGQTCAPYLCASGACATSCQNDTQCVPKAGAPTYCNAGLCEVKFLPGETCTGNAMCASGFCTDGVCCDTECTGQCEACDVEGKEGLCSAVAGPPHGSRPKCDALDPACSGQCNGAYTPKCVFPGPETACTGSSCEGNVLSPFSCDTEGSCKPGPVKDCGAYACDVDNAACKKSCATSADCASGAQCDTANSQCTITGATCKDAFTVVEPDGTETSCTPYRCSAGSCRTDCDTEADCTGGHECIGRKCVEAEPGAGGSSGGTGDPDAGPGAAATPAADDAGGCGCRTAPSSERGALPMLALALGGIMMARRRRADR